MSLCYKTTKGNKVSIDHQMNYYEWKDVREYIWWEMNSCMVYLNIGGDYIEIDETTIGKNEISYFLGNTEFMEDFDIDEQLEWNRHMKDLRDEILIVYFKVRDWWSNGLDLHAWVFPKEANWFIIKKRTGDGELDRKELKETLNYFRAYIEWSFVEISIYSPTMYIAENDPTDKIVKYNYEDGERFFRSKEEALASVDEKVWWKVLKETEDENFSMREY